MKEKKVPEEQFAFLRNKLAGNEAFGRLRGLLPPELGMLGSILKEAKSPTDFCRQWDQFSADARVIGNLLACCQRDCMDNGAEELAKALLDKTYLLPGETVPLHETEPYTVVVFDFPRTLAMIRWIRCAHWNSLNQYLNEFDGNWSGYLDRKAREQAVDWWMESKDRVLTRQLFDAFPNLSHHTRRRRTQGDYEGWDILKSYREHVIDDFDCKELVKIGYELHMAHQTYNDHLEISHGVFGYLVREEQGRVLGMFSREQQKRILTWTVRLPKVFNESPRRSFLVCFHDEQAHKGWDNTSNAYNSLGCAGEYGVVILDMRYAHPLYDHTCRYHKDVCINQVHLREDDEKLAFELSTFRPV